MYCLDTPYGDSKEVFPYPTQSVLKIILNTELSWIISIKSNSLVFKIISWNCQSYFVLFWFLFQHLNMIIESLQRIFSISAQIFFQTPPPSYMIICVINVVGSEWFLSVRFHTHLQTDIHTNEDKFEVLYNVYVQTTNNQTRKWKKFKKSIVKKVFLSPLIESVLSILFQLFH